MQGAMDKIRFSKMMRDANFPKESGPMTSTHTDHIFHRALPMVEVRF
jgi:hypothetical protein